MLNRTYWIVILLLLTATVSVGCGKSGHDLIVLQDGSRQTGTLQGCVNTSCELDNQAIPRSSIAWIGFSYAAGNPPPISNPATDEIHARDGSIASAHLIGISDSKVVTDKQSFERTQVAWIHLAPVPQRPPSGEIGQTGDEGNGKDQNDNGIAKSPSEPPFQSPPPTTRKPSPAGYDEVKPCPADKPLGGHIQVDSEWIDGACRGSRHVVLRFPLVHKFPDTPHWPGQQIWTLFTAPEVSYELSTDGCSGTEGGVTCNAPGGRKTGRVILGAVGALGFRADPQAGGYLDFSPVRPEISAEVLLSNQNPHGTPETCVHTGGGTTSFWEFRFDGLSIAPAGPHCSTTSSDYGNPYSVCVQPAECASPADEATQQDCVVHADRHAVVPFAGEEHWIFSRRHSGNGSGILNAKIHWEICCGCGAKPTPPEPSADVCPSTLEADSRLETNRKKREAKLVELKKQGAAYTEKFKEAKDHYADYAKTIKACLIQSLATKTIIALLAPEAEGAAISHDVTEAMEMAEAAGLFPPMNMQMVAKIVDKIVNGEDPTTALAAEGIQNWSETIAVLQKVETLMSTKNVDGMEKSLEECQGAFLVSAATKLSAEKGIESLKEALDHLAKFNTLKNDIRDLDTDYPDLQYKAWAACVKRARCKKTPESACDSKKPPGNWPDVQ